MLQSLLRDLERNGHVENLLAVLNGDNAPGREALAVARAIDFVKDRNAWVARANEISVERVRDAVFYRAAGRDQGLTQHLAAEDALPAVTRARAPENIDLDRFEIEEIQNFLDGFVHEAFKGWVE